jgi:hypothetical protein
LREFQGRLRARVPVKRTGVRRRGEGEKDIMNMKVVQCTCSVCTAHRLQPEIPEHVQEKQVRLEHESQARHRVMAKVFWCMALAAVVVVSAVRVLHF